MGVGVCVGVGVILMDPGRGGGGDSCATGVVGLRDSATGLTTGASCFSGFF